jgi:NAD(P) transhydrogenase
MVISNDVKVYDLIVIGSGPAGEKGAAQAAYFGKKVAIVEKDYHLGGAAAGTAIPNKTLRETSLALSAIRSRHLYGVDLSLKRKTTVQDFLHHERIVKDAERKRVKNNMKLHKVDIYKGLGSFEDKKTIKVEIKGRKPEYLKGEIILIATGSRPRRPDNFPIDPRIYDSDSILHIKKLPKKLVVIGGGVIGLEYACTFGVLGVDVSIIHNRDILLPFLDHDISFALENSISKMGITLYKSENVESCDLKTNRIDLKLGSGVTLNAEAIMLATGRSSNTPDLNLKAADITPGKYSRLVVNENYQVIHPETKKEVPDIYAVGDVIGPPALASTSMEQARYAMIKAFNLEPYKEHVAPILPLGIYTIPECSGAGKTEEHCQEENIDYVVGKASYNQNARGMIIGDNDGFLKLIFEFNDDLSKPMKLLGVHVIGEIASELVHFGISALIMNAGSDLFINTCFNYPTLGELYKYATYQAMGKRADIIKSKK